MYYSCVYYLAVKYTGRQAGSVRPSWYRLGVFAIFRGSGGERRKKEISEFSDD